MKNVLTFMAWITIAGFVFLTWAFLTMIVPIMLRLIPRF